MKKALLGLLVSFIAIHTYAGTEMNYAIADSAKAKKTKEAKPKKDDKKTDAKPATQTTQTSSSSSSASTNNSKYQLPFKTWALTVNGSFTNPYTDLKYRRFLGVSQPKNEFQWGVGLSAVHMLDGAFGIMATFNAGALQGVADSNMDDRLTWNAMRAAGVNPGGDFFKANFYEGSFNLYWDISNTIFGINRLIRGQNSGKGYKPRWVSIYAYGGLGYNYTTTHVYKLNTGQLDTTKLNGYQVFHDGGVNSLVVPVGFGVKFKLSKTIDLGIENSYHFTFTDLLDGFEYAHINNKKRDDFYSMTGVTLTIKLGTRKRDKEHIEWRNPIEGVYARLDRLDKRVDNLYKDTDGDGVSDVFDKDNNTPEGVKVYGDGTSVDSDNDGVPDYKDVEPFSDPGAKVDENGKSIDSDGDGVPDSRDLEPNTPKGNYVDNQGRSLDNRFATKDDLKNLSNGHGGFFFPSIYFEFNQDNIDRQYEPELQSIAKTLRENQGLVIKVIGYCDQRGTIPYNDDLGMRRAKKVIDYMVRVYGFPAASFEAVSVGNRTTEKAEHWINRRVDFAAKK
jgi:outer membrane protein OmpA-like peptidoglycan-associated protein